MKFHVIHRGLGLDWDRTWDWDLGWESLGGTLGIFRELWGEPSWNPPGCFVVVLGSLFAGGPRGVFGEARGTFFGRTLGTMETVLW